MINLIDESIIHSRLAHPSEGKKWKQEKKKKNLGQDTFSN